MSKMTNEEAVEVLSTVSLRVLADDADIGLVVGALSKAITALKASGEPVAWRKTKPFGTYGLHYMTQKAEDAEIWRRQGFDVQPLYLHPAPMKMLVDAAWISVDPQPPE